MKNVQKANPVAIAALVGVLLLLVGGVVYSLHQVNHGANEPSLAEQLNAEHDKDPQIQRLRKKAGIKD